MATQAGLAFVRKSVNTPVVPEESERCTTAIVWSGRFVFGLSDLIAGSFHFVIWPVKILPIVSASKFRPGPTPSTL